MDTHYSISVPKGDVVWYQQIITVGGDKFSPQPGFSVQFSKHMDGNVFDIDVRPIQTDKLEITHFFLMPYANQEISISVFSESELIASALVLVARDGNEASGTGQIQNLQAVGPFIWTFEVLAKNDQHSENRRKPTKVREF